MKTASDDLRALLATRQFYVADLWTFTLASGTVLRYSSADVDITASDGRVFSAASHLLSRGKITQKTGVEVDTLEATVNPRDDLVEGVALLSAIRTGAFDGADVALERAFMPTMGDTAAGEVIIFAGRVGDIDAGRAAATMQVNSHLELLNVKCPRLVYQASCPHTLYDTRCSVARASHEVATTVGSGATQQHIPVPSLGRPDDWAAHGVATITSGACAGLTRTVNAHASGVLTVFPPLPVAPASGDGITVAQGCDKTLATCRDVFANVGHFGGQPFVPAPETAT